jgi:succinoglycan biosynthesis transport protein ExoP
MNDTIGQDVSPASEYLRIIKRRRWLVGGIAAVAIIGSAAVAMLLPAKYQSTATILIEEPAVSEDPTRTADASSADQRLQLIQQRVMTTDKLIEVIDRLGLYRENRQTTPANLLADDMRSRIVMRLVGSDSTDAKNGRSARASTAFTLSYIGEDPAVTQQVTRELVNLYLAENERTQRDRAQGTAGFFSGETERLAARIEELESQLAEFKSSNAGMLPEELEFNTQVLDRTQNQLLELMRQGQAARERQAFLQSQLLTIEPNASVNSAAPETLSPRSRLKLLKAQYSTLLSKYGEKHPDVVRLRRQIDAMTASGTGAGAGVSVDELEAQLEAESQKYGEAHPEVVRLKRQIAAARESAGGNDLAADAPDNPIYIQTQGQLSAVNAEIGMVQSQIAAMQAKIAEVEARILKSPEVERGYVAIKREYDASVSKLNDLRQRESQAELAKNLDAEQMGQRLSLIEPPPLPMGPVAPNRLAILLLGIIVGFGGGIGAAILIDSLDGRVYGPRRLAAIAGAAPLVLVPRIQTVYDPRPRRHRFAMIALFLLVAAGVLMSDIKMPAVDALWTTVLDKVATL